MFNLKGFSVDILIQRREALSTVHEFEVTFTVTGLASGKLLETYV